MADEDGDQAGDVGPLLTDLPPLCLDLVADALVRKVGPSEAALAACARSLARVSWGLRGALAQRLYDAVDPGCTACLSEKAWRFSEGRVRLEAKAGALRAAAPPPTDASASSELARRPATELKALCRAVGAPSSGGTKDQLVRGYLARVAETEAERVETLGVVERALASSAAAEASGRRGEAFALRCPVRSRIRRLVAACRQRPPFRSDRYYSSSVMRVNRVTATMAKEELGATDAVLRRLECVRVTNPHNSHAPHMRLYEPMAVIRAMIAESGPGDVPDPPPDLEAAVAGELAALAAGRVRQRQRSARTSKAEKIVAELSRGSLTVAQMTAGEFGVASATAFEAFVDGQRTKEAFSDDVVSATARVARQRELEAALASAGLTLSQDPVLCGSYVLRGEGTLEDVATSGREMDFLRKHTRYVAILRELKDRQRSRSRTHRYPRYDHYDSDATTTLPADLSTTPRRVRSSCTSTRAEAVAP